MFNENCFLFFIFSADTAVNIEIITICNSLNIYEIFCKVCYELFYKLSFKNITSSNISVIAFINSCFVEYMERYKRPAPYKEVM